MVDLSQYGVCSNKVTYIIVNIWKGIIDCQSNMDRTVICYARFEVLTLVLIKIHVFWDVTILVVNCDVW